MKKILLGVTAVGAFAFGGGSEPLAAVSPIEDVMQDKTPIYIGLGAGAREIENFGHYFGTVLAGYEFSEYFGLEGRYNLGSDHNALGGYFKAQYPMEIFTPYLLAGFAHFKYDNASKESFNGFSYGAGLDAQTPYENMKVFGDILTFEGAPAHYDTEHVLTVGFKYFFD